MFWALSCHRSEAAPEPAPPSGEVWLTDRQVNEGGLVMTTAVQKPVNTTIQVAGRVTFSDALVAHVFSPVSGRVTKIQAEPGQRLKKGDVLAFIDSPDVGVASAEVDKASADLAAAERDYRRQKELYEAHAGAQRDYEGAEVSYLKAKAESERARQKARLLRTGTIDAVTQNYVLRAPIDGEVVGRNISPGMEVQGQYSGGTAVELFTVGELDPVWVVANIFEMDLARVKNGAAVTVHVVSYPERGFDGTLGWISGTLDPATHTVHARCSVANPEHLLKPEMYATAAIHVSGQEALVVPKRAVLRLADQTVVFVAMPRSADGRSRFQRRVVTVNEDEGDDLVPVTHGLEAGESVVVDGALLLSGML